MLGEIRRNPSFTACVLWTDEALFTREGCFNAHNAHVWDDENRVAIRRRAAQHRWSVNVWSGICGEFIVGPYLLPRRLDDPAYQNFLEHDLPGFLEEIPSEIRKNMIFQYDGTPAHFATYVCRYLDNTFLERWIGHGGAVAAPPRSCSRDLNPLDFYLWVHLKNEIYRHPVSTEEEVVGQIHAVVATITP